tara:strand:+ start:449 stop:1669 length:1221 start_codon:yes stop_codon:yes gene_type:complete
MTHEFFSSVIDKYTNKKNKVYIRSKFLNDYATPDNWKRIDTWKGENIHDFMNASTIYNPDNPYDMLEINPFGDPFTHPIKSYIPNDSQKKTINKKIDNLQDLIDIIEENPIITNIEYNIDLNSLHKILPSLKKLNNMIGMEMVKENIVDQLLYYIQDLHINKNTTTDFMHTVLYGPPGTGKTEIAQIIGEIFSNLGILEKKVFKKVIRSDLIAGYLGQTALKTKDVINSCLGGVLFIDEAYALGSQDKKDSYSKECLDILCEALSAHKENLMVIIAGYEDQLQECFFEANQGLDSRFCWRFYTEKYSAKELMQIFMKKVNEIGWTIDEDYLENSEFGKNIDNFTSYGRDMELLLSKVKICHSRRVFTLPVSEKTKISLEDMNSGITLFTKHKRKQDNFKNFQTMYT